MNTTNSMPQGLVSGARLELYIYKVLYQTSLADFIVYILKFARSLLLLGLWLRFSSLINAKESIASE